jgi:uncharacterized membrane protein YkvA (DUF1232 family)
MSKEPKKTSIIPSQSGGLIQDVVRHIKLIWLLISDKRVNIFLKILPVASLVYLVSPVDFLPGLALPIIGALDDAAIIWIGTSLFINLCPENVVNEHTLALEKSLLGTWKNSSGDDEIVDAVARDITDEPSK